MAKPGYRTLEVLVLKDKSPTDKAQVPAAAAVDVYFQGATISEAVVVPSGGASVSLPVFESGRITTGDTVSSGFQGTTFGVVSVSETSISVNNAGGPDVPIAAGTRLLIISRRPTLYSGPLGAPGEAIPNPLSTNATNGRATAYVPEFRFDYVVSGTGVVTQVYPDAMGGRATTPIGWLNVRDYSSVQEAIDAAAASGAQKVVYVPAGVYNPNTIPAFVPPLLFPHEIGFQLQGDGMGASVLEYRSGQGYPIDANLDLVRIRHDQQHLRGITLVGPSIVGTGCGVRIWEDQTSPPLTYGTRIVDCEIVGSASWGIRIDDVPVAGQPRFAVWAIYDNVEIRGVMSGGCVYIGPVSTTQYFTRCRFLEFAGHAVFCNSCAASSFTDCYIERTGTGGEPIIKLSDTTTVLFSHCDVRGWQLEPYLHATGTTRGLTVDSCHFEQGPQNNIIRVRDKLVAIKLSDWARGVVIANPSLQLAGGNAAEGWASIVIDGNPDPTRQVEATILGGAFTDSLTATDPSPVHHYFSVVDGSPRTVLVNVMQRLRLPRLTQAEISALPVVKDGDLVYNITTNKAQVFTGVPIPPHWQDLW